eukprot:TRINITY_DN47857_c0_g1_i1.p2 TRINITY_DN47857_c0_g1~~TRINITY_DN47857_c0_g1_i1.p2  ORF type:complete len:288 (+),score=111.47 TRINITY_DN47857_c0_g1_i1:64-864(+)
MRLWVLAAAAAAAAEADPQQALPGVRDLAAAEFHEAVGDGRHWLVEFYAPWCGWCKKLVPTMRELGAAVGEGDTKLAIAKFDATQDGAASVTESFGVRGFPTLVLVRDKGYEAYRGAREAAAIMKWLHDRTGAAIGPHKDALAAVGRIRAGSGEVAQLTAKTLSAAVDPPQRHYFVRVHAPWCSRSRESQPVWQRFAAAAAAAAPDLVVADFDGDRFGELAEKHGVEEFPWLLFFAKGAPMPEHYDGPLTEEALLQFVQERAGPPE